MFEVKVKVESRVRRICCIIYINIKVLLYLVNNFVSYAIFVITDSSHETCYYLIKKIKYETSS